MRFNVFKWRLHLKTKWHRECSANRRLTYFRPWLLLLFLARAIHLLVYLKLFPPLWCVKCKPGSGIFNDPSTFHYFHFYPKLIFFYMGRPASPYDVSFSHRRDFFFKFKCMEQLDKLWLGLKITFKKKKTTYPHIFSCIPFNYLVIICRVKYFFHLF